MPQRVATVAAGAVALLLAACSELPTNYPRAVSTRLEVTGATRIGRALAPLLGEAPDTSAFHPLGNGLDAFVARLAFAEAAERSIDVQYYLFHDDLSGRALTAYLLSAADRGVRVRVLLDDMDMNGRDAGLASIALHPNMEIRLFNPFPSRSLRHLNFITHFGTVTRRMHNKAFIVDNQVAIVGGRNIGDEYFDAATDTNFGDMDVLAAGPIVTEVSDSFDRYWNSELAYPVEALGASGDPELLREARESLARETVAVAKSNYGRRLRESNLASDLARQEVLFYHGAAQLLADLPEKVTTDPGDRSTHLGPELADILSSAQRQLIAISPYFVPGKQGSQLLEDLARRGVQVTVVTNSLASNDVPAVHAGYVRYRRRLLEAGIELYETRPSPRADDDGERRFGASQASLHAKTFAIDGEQVLVGSMNFDPRSDQLNTEMGILIDSPELAGAMNDWRRNDLPRYAWQVVLDDTPEGRRRLRWIDGADGQRSAVAGTEPEAGFWRRLIAGVLRFLPIEKQL